MLAGFFLRLVLPYIPHIEHTANDFVNLFRPLRTGRADSEEGRYVEIIEQ